MRTALALAALAVLATACGDASAEPTVTPTAEETAAVAANAVTVATGVTSPDLLQCLAQSGLEAWGADPRTTGTPADYVEAERSSFTLPDTVGGLWVFADAETAATYAQDAFEADLIDDLDPATATAEVHGNVLVTAERPFTEPRLLACLPDAATPTVVAAPAPGTVTFGSLMTCLRDAGLSAKGDVNDPYDATFAITGTLDVRDAELEALAYVRVFADPGAVAAYDGDAADQHAGNTVTTHKGEQPDPRVTGCLPA